MRNDYEQSPWQTTIESGYMQPPHDQPPAKSRKKSKKKSGVLVNLIVGISFLAFGACMWTFSVDYYGRYVETTGTIVSVDRHEACYKDGHCSPVGYPTIEYMVDGEKISSKFDRGSDSYDSSDVGRQLEVKYDPSDPSDMVVAKDADDSNLVMKIFSGGFMGFGALCIVTALVGLLKKIIKLVTPL